MSTASATVVKIDKQARKLWLRDAQGKEMQLSVPQEVRSFDLIRTGDRVNVQYYEAAVVSIRKPGEPAPPMGEREQMERGTMGQKPEATMMKQTTMAATIMSVDTQRHTVTLRGADGKPQTLTVKDPELQRRLSDLKPGDQVDVTLTEAMVISLQPAAPAK